MTRPFAPGERSRQDQGPSIGLGYWRLWTATTISSLGDGVFLTALPLLATQLSQDPLAISAVTFTGYLPWLLFGLLSGALVDRWDRRQVLVTVDAARLAVAGVLAGTVLVGWASIPLLMAVAFLLSTGETLSAPASLSLVPSLVSRDQQRLERANGRLFGAQTVAENLAGRSAGGLLFALAAPLTFLVDALSFGVSAVLVAAIPGRFREQHPAEASPDTLRALVIQGLRWLAGQRLLAVLAVSAGVSNLLGTAWPRSWCCSPNSTSALGVSATACSARGWRSEDCSEVWSRPGSASGWVPAESCSPFWRWKGPPRWGSA